MRGRAAPQTPVRDRRSAPAPPPPFRGPRRGHNSHFAAALIIAAGAVQQRGALPLAELPFRLPEQKVTEKGVEAISVHAVAAEKGGLAHQPVKQLSRPAAANAVGKAQIKASVRREVQQKAPEPRVEAAENRRVKIVEKLRAHRRGGLLRIAAAPQMGSGEDKRERAALRAAQDVVYLPRRRFRASRAEEAQRLVLPQRQCGTGKNRKSPRRPERQQPAGDRTAREQHKALIRRVAQQGAERAAVLPAQGGQLIEQQRVPVAASVRQGKVRRTGVGISRPPSGEQRAGDRGLPIAAGRGEKHRSAPLQSRGEAGAERGRDNDLVGIQGAFPSLLRKISELIIILAG